MEFFKASCSINEVKQRKPQLYPDGMGARRANWSVFLSAFKAAFTLEAMSLREAFETPLTLYLIIFSTLKCIISIVEAGFYSKVLVYPDCVVLYPILKTVCNLIGNSNMRSCS